jgi:hypothetical protein
MSLLESCMLAVHHYGFRWNNRCILTLDFCLLRTLSSSTKAGLSALLRLEVGGLVEGVSSTLMQLSLLSTWLLNPSITQVSHLYDPCLG